MAEKNKKPKKGKLYRAQLAAGLIAAPGDFISIWGFAKSKKSFVKLILRKESMSAGNFVIARIRPMHVPEYLITFTKQADTDILKTHMGLSEQEESMESMK